MIETLVIVNVMYDKAHMRLFGIHIAKWSPVILCNEQSLDPLLQRDSFAVRFPVMYNSPDHMNFVKFSAACKLANLIRI